MIAFIGGSGFEKFEDFKALGGLERETPFGQASSGIKKVKIDGFEALFVSRHGENHELLPSEINYRANIYALKKNGATSIVSFSAVGSLQKELKPGDLVIPNQYIDKTKSLRAHSFCGEGVVGHISLAKPTCRVMDESLRKEVAKLNFELHFDKTYVCIEGPYFSTVAEAHANRQIKADIVGMTNFPEYALAREAGLPYLPCCFVTDYDCWDASIPHVTVEEVIKVMRNNNSKAFELVKLLFSLGEFWKGSNVPNEGLKAGLFCDPSSLNDLQQQWLKVLTS